MKIQPNSLLLFLQPIPFPGALYPRTQCTAANPSHSLICYIKIGGIEWNQYLGNSENNFYIIGRIQQNCKQIRFLHS